VALPSSQVSTFSRKDVWNQSPLAKVYIVGRTKELETVVQTYGKDIAGRIIPRPRGNADQLRRPEEPYSKQEVRQ
jgi:hypothetical protein